MMSPVMPWLVVKLQILCQYLQIIVCNSSVSVLLVGILLSLETIEPAPECLGCIFIPLGVRSASYSKWIRRTHEIRITLELSNGAESVFPEMVTIFKKKVNPLLTSFNSLYLNDRIAVRSGAETGLLSLRPTVSQGVSVGDFLLALACPIENVTLWQGFFYLTLGSGTDNGVAKEKVFARTGNSTRGFGFKAQYAIH